jgi:O-antigen ligase
MGLILILAVLRPHVGVFVLLAALWLDQLYPWSGLVTLNRAVGFVTLAGLVSRKALRIDPRRFVVGRFDYACWVYVFLALLGAWVNGPTSQTWEYLRGTLGGYLIYFLMLNSLNHWRKLRTALWVLVICSLIIAVSALTEAFRLPEATVKSRITGVQSVETTGFSGAMATLIVLWLTEGASFHRKLLYWTLLPCFSAAIFLSGNRTALVAWGASIVLLGIYRTRGVKSFGTVVMVMLSILGGILLVSSAAPRALQRTLDIPLSLVLDDSTQPNVVSRINLSRASWQMFLAHPILGVGLGSFSFYATAYGAPPGADEHNLFTGTLGQMGIFGAGALLLMYSSVLLPLWRKVNAPGVPARAKHVAIYALTLIFAYNIVAAVAHGGYVHREKFVLFAVGAIALRLLDSESHLRSASVHPSVRCSARRAEAASVCLHTRVE